MSKRKRAKLIQWRGDRIRDWVAAELAKGGIGVGDDRWCEAKSAAASAAVGTSVPPATLRAHVFALRARLAKAALEGGEGSEP
jgi:hypothetical protein